MTVAANIEILPGGAPAPGGIPGAGSGRSLGAGKALLAASSGPIRSALTPLNSSTGGGAPSFRSGLQSLLEALHLDGFNLDASPAEFGSEADSGAGSVQPPGVSADSTTGSVSRSSSRLDATTNGPALSADGANSLHTGAAPAASPSSLSLAVQRSASNVLWSIATQPSAASGLVRKSSGVATSSLTAAAAQKNAERRPSGLSTPQNTSGIGLALPAPPAPTPHASEGFAPFAAQSPSGVVLPDPQLSLEAIPSHSISTASLEINRVTEQGGLVPTRGDSPATAAPLSRNSPLQRASASSLSNSAGLSTDPGFVPKDGPADALSSRDFASGTVSSINELSSGSGARTSTAFNVEPIAADQIAAPRTARTKVPSPLPIDFSRTFSTYPAPLAAEPRRQHRISANPRKEARRRSRLQPGNGCPRQPTMLIRRQFQRQGRVSQRRRGFLCKARRK